MASRRSAARTVLALVSVLSSIVVLGPFRTMGRPRTALRGPDIGLCLAVRVDDTLPPLSAPPMSIPYRVRKFITESGAFTNDRSGVLSSPDLHREDSGRVRRVGRFRGEEVLPKRQVVLKDPQGPRPDVGERIRPMTLARWSVDASHKPASTTRRR